MLESQLHEFSCFVTLTYNNESLPDGGNLEPRHTQLWLKVLRKRLASQGRALRYFLCGEYGETTWRPHYHAALFGVSPFEWELVQSTWKYGNVDNVLTKRLGTLTTDSALYISGYVTKKMTQKDDPRLRGLHPEFARMSLNPGIGAGAVEHIVDALNDKFGARYTAENLDAPLFLTHGKKQLPLGKYLRKGIRDGLGFNPADREDQLRKISEARLRTMCPDPQAYPQFEEDQKTRNKVKIRQIESKFKIFKKKDSL